MRKKRTRARCRAAGAKVCALVLAPLALAVSGCEPQTGPDAGSPAHTLVTIQAASSLQPLLDGLVGLYEESHSERSLLIRYAGSQALARQIDAGADVDAFLSADAAALQTLARTPDDTRTWIGNDLVVIAHAESAAILDDLAMGDERIAIAADNVPLGAYTRLAMRMAGYWRTAEIRSTQFTSASQVLQQVASGTYNIGIVYSTDASREPDRVRVLGTLELPENVEITYRAASFTVEGARFIDWLFSPEVSRIALEAGYRLPEAAAGGAP